MPTTRSTLAPLGVITAALFFFMSTLHESTGLLAHIAEIDRAAGIVAAAVVAIGADGAAQGAVFALRVGGRHRHPRSAHPHAAGVAVWPLALGVALRAQRRRAATRR